MTKSYWLKKISIPNADLFLEYIRTVLPWIKSVGGVIVKRDLIQESTSNEWDGGQLGLVIEFESKFAAKKAFYSEVFQKRAIRTTPPKLPNTLQIISIFAKGKIMINFKLFGNITYTL